jgi:hypothetical protein
MRYTLHGHKAHGIVSLLCTQSGSEIEILDQLRSYGLGEEHTNGIFGRSLRNQEMFTTWMANRRHLEQTREEDG